MLKAAVFDWAGTIIDHGSVAPVGAFVRAFARFGVEITLPEAREPMGMAKRDHIAALLAQPRIAAEWRAAQGTLPDAAAIDRLLEVFVPMTLAAVAEHGALIAGAVPVIGRLRARGLKIGTTTGYTREIMAAVLPLAAAQGFAPDSVVCAGDLPQGRPAPLMMYRTLAELGVWPAQNVVKIDDTGVGIAEGLNAGCWTVGVAMTGNAFGLTPGETGALAPDERARRRAAAVSTLTRSGAHYVIDSVADLEPVIDTIEGRLARGDRP